MVSNARVGKSNELVGSFSGELGRSKEVDEKCCQLIRDNLRWASALNYPHGVPPRPCLFGDIHKLNIPDLYCPGTSYNQKKEKSTRCLYNAKSVEHTGAFSGKEVVGSHGLQIMAVVVCLAKTCRGRTSTGNLSMVRQMAFTCHMESFASSEMSS